jgi:acetyl esterase/lipase
MKNLICTLAMLVLSITAMAQKVVEVTPVIIDLWPNGAPNNNELVGEEYRNKDNRITNVTHPTLTVFQATNPNGMAVIACPGGGYQHLAFEHEGTDFADWYNSQGITLAVLKYRMPNGHFECPRSDIQQAMSLMHQHAKEWGVDENKIGVQGASAGGHLAATLATGYRTPNERPAFQIMFYGAITPKMAERKVDGSTTKSTLAFQENTLEVTANTPPAFIMVSADDRLCGDLCLDYFKALKNAGVYSSLHVYPEGGHGWGFKDAFKYKPMWTMELKYWLEELNKKLDVQKADIIQKKIIENGGTGAYKSIAAKVNTLNDYVIYRPSDMQNAVKSEKKPLPMVVFANGGCHDCSVRFESMLNEIASHGYVVIALGELRMNHDLKGNHKTNAQQLIYALDWMEKQVKDPKSEYYNMVDIKHVASAGQSCGGAQVLTVCGDSRFKAHIMYNSGMGDMSMAGASKESLKNLHAPILYMPGGDDDVATKNALTDYDNITIVPVVLANHKTAGHVGAFDEPNGGSYAKLSLDWLDWLLKGKKSASKVFMKGNSKLYPMFEIKSKQF